MPRVVVVRMRELQDRAVKKVKGKGWVLAITALLTRELVTRSALQSWKWQLIGMS